MVLINGSLGTRSMPVARAKPATSASGRRTLAWREAAKPGEVAMARTTWAIWSGAFWLRLQTATAVATLNATGGGEAAANGAAQPDPGEAAFAAYAGARQDEKHRQEAMLIGLLLSGGLVTLAFIARELIISRPFLNLGRLLRGNLPLLMLALAGFRFIILSTAYI